VYPVRRRCAPAERSRRRGGGARNGLVNITAPADTMGLYLIAGAGAYYFYQDPSAQGAVRPGVSAGAGLAFRVGAHSQLFVETRYHKVLGAASSVTWLAPVTLGLRF
jgi:hypothetical protein